MTKKQIALQYLNKGLSVIPLVSPSMCHGNLTEEEIIYKCKRSPVKWKEFSNMPNDRIWSNLSERGMNKAIPAIIKRRSQSWPVEYTDRWGNTCHVSNGHWEVKNYRVMEVVGYPTKAFGPFG